MGKKSWIFPAVMLLLSACGSGSGREDTTNSPTSVHTDVVVGGEGPSGARVAGSTVTFVMTVTNNGPDTASDFNVSDNVGSGLSLTGIACAASGGAVCPATVGVATAVDALPAGGVLTFTVTTVAGINVNGTVSNEMDVNVATNSNKKFNAFYATATIVAADLVVTGAAPDGPLLGGTTSAFTMTVTNSGPAVSENISIANTLSAGITAAGPVVCSATAGAVCPMQLGGTVAVPSLPVNGALTFTIPFTVDVGMSGQVSDTMVVSSTSDPRGNRSATAAVGTGSSFLVVTETTDTEVNAGDNAVFTAVVTNTGSAVAQDVQINYVLTGSAGTVATVTCTAAAGVSCPPALGPTMTLPVLNPGRSLTFQFTVAVPTSARGQITNTVSVSALGNGNTAGYQASASTLSVNPDNGTYTLFAANGLKYRMDINFDSGSYTISGVGPDLHANFTADPVGGGFTVSGTQRFRVATNFIVGGQDFGGGVIPYAAARVFGTNVQQLAGVFGGLYDLFTYKIPVGGPPVTTVGTARVSGNVLSICQSATQVAIPQNCSNLPAGSLQSYVLTVDGKVYQGTNTVTGQALRSPFQLAVIGATAALLSAEIEPDGSQQMMIGLPDASVIAGGTEQGASTDGDWVTMTLTNDNYAYTGQSGGSDSAPLQNISATAGPFSMLKGNRASDGALIYVGQSFPLAVAIGATNGAASGLFQLTLP